MTFDALLWSDADPIVAREAAVARSWDETRTFDRSVENRAGRKTFVQYDGPPFATGRAHFGHILAMTLKDAFCRYRTMRGDHVPRRFLWDCHGVPVETLALREFHGIDNAPVAAFNDTCRSLVMRCREDWRDVVRRIGRFIDFDADGRTMDRDYMESVFAVFQRLHERGLVYSGLRVQAYSPALGTAISNFEAALNYQTIESPSITLAFRLRSEPDTALLVWTTTPWSVPANVAIAINVELPYVRVLTREGASYVLAAAALGRYFDPAAVSVEPVDPAALLGARYEPVLDHALPFGNDACWRVVHSHHVSETDGTGLVHICPAYGEDDFRVGSEHALPTLDFLDSAARFGPAVPTVAGLGFRDANPAIMDELAARGRLFRRETILHSYPMCWRTDQPLLYRAVEGWFVAVSRLRERLVACNEAIEWFPESVGRGRFGQWLADARDWNVSRSRNWGTPIPIWRCEETGEVIVVGSVAELERLTGVRPDDLHREHLDRLEIRRDGKVFRRIDQVFDCWFESGCVPYGQCHYPFDAPETFDERFPADLICEGLDQTRGWFYTLHVLAVALFDRPAFRRVVVNGILLGSDGKKMSKRLGNYPPVEHVLDTYGGDALRLYLLGSKATRAQEQRVVEADIRATVRDVHLAVASLYQFFATYANELGLEPGLPATATDGLDRWLLHATDAYRADVEAALDGYDTAAACRALRQFLESVSNFYVRGIRRRVVAGRDAAPLRCLHHALTMVALTVAPLAPFAAERLWAALGGQDSVHLQDWPAADGAHAAASPTVVAADHARRVIQLGRRLRAERNLRTRQPLRALYVDVRTAAALVEFEWLVRDELNVLSVVPREDVSALCPTRVVLDFARLGRRLRGSMKAVQAAVQAGAWRLAEGTLQVAGEVLEPGDFRFEQESGGRYAVAAEGELTVALDTEVDPELTAAGLRRDLTRRVQDLRRTLACRPSEVVRLEIDPGLVPLVDGHRSDLELVLRCRFQGPVPVGARDVQTVQIGGETYLLRLIREPAAT